MEREGERWREEVEAHKELLGGILVEVIVARHVVQETGKQERSLCTPGMQLLSKRCLVLCVRIHHVSISPYNTKRLYNMLCKLLLYVIHSYRKIIESYSICPTFSFMMVTHDVVFAYCVS